MKKRGFTIVELLVVIVVIAILAAITVVSYSGISRKATEATLQSDLTNSANKLKMYNVEYGIYPTMEEPDSNGTLCPASPETDTKYCIKPSPGNAFTYSSNSPYYTFALDATNTASGVTYNITDNTGPAIGSSEPAEPSIPTVTIGSQVWMQNNLNEGTKISGSTNQSNNSTDEKWCYDDIESNCTTYGGLYQWDEMMQYVTTEAAQGLCPVGFHLPTDAEFKTMEIYLGMTALQANSTGFRGTDQGTKIKTGGSTGFNWLPGGANPGGYYDIGSYGYLWTSTQIDATYAWLRDFDTLSPQIERVGFVGKQSGLSVRCIQN